MKRIFYVIIALILCCSVFTGCTEKIEGFEACLVPLENLEVPQEATIIALGEATHGNVEFQQMKLDVFRILVEKNGVHAFALEADFGGCAVFNDYIQGKGGTADEAVSALGFRIYRTAQMTELAEWMKEYNSTAAEEDKLRFYGFDMQRKAHSIQGLLDFYGKVGAAPDERLAAAPVSEDAELDVEAVKAVLSDLEANRETYTAASSESEYAYACRYAECLVQGVDINSSIADYAVKRDRYMTENVKWILDRERLLSEGKVMLSGHNGHVARKELNYMTMGRLLSDEFGGEYYVIGTDFYNTECNMPNGDGRANQSFCSKSPLAAQLKGLDNVMYFSFETAKSSPAISEIISSPVKMGSLGESYSVTMKIMPSSYRIDGIPTEFYDDMILVYNASPTEISMAE